MEINDQSRLLQLNYRPLTDPVPNDLVTSYQADHEAADREAGYDPSYLQLGSRPWLRRLRLDTFARYNNLSYSPLIDTTPFTNIGFYQKRYSYSRSAADVLATTDGQVMVGSFIGPGGPSGRSLTKFAMIFLGHTAPDFTLTPRATVDNQATDEFNRHFRFEGEVWESEFDTRALAPLIMPEVVQRLTPEDKARLPLDLQYAAEQAEQKKQGWWARHRARGERNRQISQVINDGHRRFVAEVFGGQLGDLIVQEALGFSFETHKTKLYVYKTFFDEEVLVKPELLQQLFRIAAVVGPPFAQATRKKKPGS